MYAIFLFPALYCIIVHNAYRVQRRKQYPKIDLKRQYWQKY